MVEFKQNSIYAETIKSCFETLDTLIEQHMTDAITI